MSRTLTAFHEAGHAVAAHLLGGTVELVSIRPDDHRDGWARCAGPSWDSELALSFRPELPVTMQPRDLRDGMERDLLIRLAGTLAETLAPRPGPVDLIPPEVDAAERRAADLSHLSPRHRELARAVPDGPIRTDAEVATEWAEALAGDEARQYVAWLTAVAARMVREAAGMIRALAAELERRVVVPGPEAVALMEQARLGRKGSE